MDPKEQLLETWHINARLNLYLLAALKPEQLSIGLAKGKSVEGQFAHIHNVRLMWLKAAAPDLHEGQAKLEPPGIELDAIPSALEQSAEAIAQLLDRSWESGRVKNFKPHVTAFLGYLIAHEANHRGHVEVALRQAGQPIDDKTGYGLWEWGVR
jgi:uncharacterized damage-inducible protein DinB